MLSIAISLLCFLSGFNPVWNEYFTFTVEVPELALVRILVYDTDRYVDDFIGYYVVPFNSLMQGRFQDINWSKQVKPHLRFSNRLNAKTFMSVLSQYVIELRVLHKLFSEVATMFLLNMCYVPLILTNFP